MLLDIVQDVIKVQLFNRNNKINFYLNQPKSICLTYEICKVHFLNQFSMHHLIKLMHYLIDYIYVEPKYSSSSSLKYSLILISFDLQLLNDK